ncbi:hypothetical protein BCR32DRAFT_282219 [Anaeromyces robustus]|uniref:Helicase ATP-binding domain-containing protein n=1 Tax=Anaeromyces robustus TaxID=1754192 RepID=A0A1Y1WY97_9FUNG|nr:hypothetical protein BCR32DRAFT_282219 [Anaeromyces robustus]|eukprot:ORX78473.1 hypothetical protein BCR32DRAFT_282219 [Anaeromyces robustus]
MGTVGKAIRFREFSEVYTNDRLIEENVHMKRYQILPIRYMSPENEIVRRFLIYHSSGTGKSFTALWIILNFINVYHKPSIILVKSKESIMEFTQRVKSWYSFTFKYSTPLPNINNYQQFIKKYIEFHTYLTFCKSINEDYGNKNDTNSSYSVYDERLIIVDEVHHFRNTLGNKIIYHQLLLLLNHINKGLIIFMSATPIFDNYNEMTNFIKLMKPNFKSDKVLTPEKLEEIMRGHLSYYGLSPSDTLLNFIGSSVPGIQHYKIVKVPMQGVQLANYQNLIQESITNICNIGIKYVKATLGVIRLNNDNSTHHKAMSKASSSKPLSKTSTDYILKNNQIIHSNPILQNVIRQQSTDIKNYCCKLYHCLEEINSSDGPDGPVFIYCNIIHDVGIYYFSALLCSMGYNYVYDTKSSMKYGHKVALNNWDLESNPHNDSLTYIENLESKPMQKQQNNNKRWNFTFITGDKRLCPNVMERLNIFNDSSNKDGSRIKVLLGSDILSESVDIMNVRQLHLLTPHWNYEKIHQIIGRVRRVGSHDSFPPDQRFVNIYLYMAYDGHVECSNSIAYSIDYVKYRICENKYKEALKYKKALQNASIEFLVNSTLKDTGQNNNINSNTMKLELNKTNITNEITPTTKNCNTNNFLIPIPNAIPQYSSIYLNKVLPKFLEEINKVLEAHFSLFDFISLEDLMEKMPIINSFLLPKLIEFIKNNNIVVAGGILSYSRGMLYRKNSKNYPLDDNLDFVETSISNNIPTVYSNEKIKNKNRKSLSTSTITEITDITTLNINVNKEEILTLEELLKNNRNKKFYKQITKYTYVEIFEILKYALQYNLVNIKKIFYPYWKEYDHSIYISYLSCIKNNSYLSNKKQTVDEFTSNIIYTDQQFNKWNILKNTAKLYIIALTMKNHYENERIKRINHRCKYVYILCNDFTIRYRDLNSQLNFCNQKNLKSDSVCTVNRGRNIFNIYKKMDLLEMMIYSICYDDMENILSPIPNYTKISVDDLKKINIDHNEENKYRLLINHILNIVTNSNIEEYCNKRPRQAFLLHQLLSSFSLLIKMDRMSIIEIWEEYLFKYNLIVIL